MGSIKRIVFVDPDARTLDDLRQALRRYRHEWDMEFVGGGAQALHLMDTQPVDAVVTDASMPGMDGADLLARVRSRHPEVVRLIMSDPSGRDAALKAANVTHQFLPKPVEWAVLERILLRSLALQDSFANEGLRSIVTGMQSLPSVPRIYTELAACANREDVNMHRVADIVKRDAGVCAKVLQIANSALFGVGQQTTNVEQAVVYMGLNVIKGLALTMSLYRGVEDTVDMPGFHLEQEQNHALAVAQLARLIAGAKVHPDTAFTAGVLHDVGKAVLAVGKPEYLRSAMILARAEHRHLYHAERDLWSVDHAVLGAHLLTLWGLPQQVVEGVAYHHDPLGAAHPEFDIVTTVHVADALVREREALVWGRRLESPTDWLDAEYVGRLEIEDRLPMWRTAAMGLVQV